MAPTVHILIPAAGASSRMRGADKLMLDAGGMPLLRKVVQTALATGAPVVVTLPYGNSDRRKALAGMRLQIVEIPDPWQGMSRSLAIGVQAIEAGETGADDGVMVLPADMPDFTAKALFKVIAAFRASPDLILRGAALDRPGHPVIFPKALWRNLKALSGDEGGRLVVQSHQGLVKTLPLPGQMALTDLDTPEAWAEWTERQR